MFLDGDAWNDCFDSMRSEAWRLETLPVYTMPQEAEKLARFLAGENSPDDYASAWMDEVRAWTSEGKYVGRVHILTRPLSNHPNPGLPDQDFWMFDESKVVLMNYRPDGTQTGRELYEGDPEPYRNWRRLAVAESVPFLEYVGG